MKTSVRIPCCCSSSDIAQQLRCSAKTSAQVVCHSLLRLAPAAGAAAPPLPLLLPPEEFRHQAQPAPTGGDRRLLLRRCPVYYCTPARSVAVVGPDARISEPPQLALALRSFKLLQPLAVKFERVERVRQDVVVHTAPERGPVELLMGVAQKLSPNR